MPTDKTLGKMVRREWDSNPRGLFAPPVFKTGAFNHSAIPPIAPSYTCRNGVLHNFLLGTENSAKNFDSTETFRLWMGTVWWRILRIATG